MPSISDAVNVRSMDDLKALFGLIGTLIDDIQVDLLSNFEISHTYTITSKPVEHDSDGSNAWVNDARIKNPTKLSMSGVLTNSIENLTGTGMIKTAIMGKGKGMFDSWKQKREYLLELKDTNKVMDVVTPTTIHRNMMLESLSFTQSNALDCCFFQADFVEVVIRFTEGMESEVDDSLSDIMGAG